MLNSNTLLQRPPLPSRRQRLVEHAVHAPTVIHTTQVPEVQCSRPRRQRRLPRSNTFASIRSVAVHVMNGPKTTLFRLHQKRCTETYPNAMEILSVREQVTVQEPPEIQNIEGTQRSMMSDINKFLKGARQPPTMMSLSLAL